ncbi:hypothetical protein M8542_14480 [Amycolatopsis sp. OK19-0408]|uniref:Uncharacterized protein n=1 Tax=Amycolatopsis iheyensis TaxID=2945988 RepID=A0A9X2SIS1_9PSEU|nr:hypothetical protein [Amycolatopsis iheyensis]MCR6484027.1 hypothetical protein [Amycolatopsis iheyensis]
MPEQRSPDRLTFSKDSNLVGFDELFEAAAEPVVEAEPTGMVLGPACRTAWPNVLPVGVPHPLWELLRQVVFGDAKHAWRSVLLLVVLGAVICGILLAGSVTLTAAGAALVGLVGLLRLSRWQAGRVRLT